MDHGLDLRLQLAGSASIICQETDNASRVLRQWDSGLSSNEDIDSGINSSPQSFSSSDISIDSCYDRKSKRKQQQPQQIPAFSVTSSSMSNGQTKGDTVSRGLPAINFCDTTFSSMLHDHAAAGQWPSAPSDNVSSLLNLSSKPALMFDQNLSRPLVTSSAMSSFPFPELQTAPIGTSLLTSTSETRTIQPLLSHFPTTRYQGGESPHIEVCHDGVAQPLSYPLNEAFMQYLQQLAAAMTGYQQGLAANGDVANGVKQGDILANRSPTVPALAMDPIRVEGYHEYHDAPQVTSRTNYLETGNNCVENGIIDLSTKPGVYRAHLHTEPKLLDRKLRGANNDVLETSANNDLIKSASFASLVTATVTPEHRCHPGAGLQNGNTTKIMQHSRYKGTNTPMLTPPKQFNPHFSVLSENTSTPRVKNVPNGNLMPHTVPTSLNFNPGGPKVPNHFNFAAAGQIVPHPTASNCLPPKKRRRSKVTDTSGYPASNAAKRFCNTRTQRNLAGGTEMSLGVQLSSVSLDGHNHYGTITQNGPTPTGAQNAGSPQHNSLWIKNEPVGSHSEMNGFPAVGPLKYLEQSDVLTPVHLRKAKLMFFYTRYPSSATLKQYFPDVQFHKNNTAQIVKWFSNFREFYYIQVEKYGRKTVLHGPVGPQDLEVTTDSELYRTLTLHYQRNHNSTFQVPNSFRSVMQTTLSEFVRAIQENRDTEPSWKKAIYKVIAQLDETLPEAFKHPEFVHGLDFYRNS